MRGLAILTAVGLMLVTGCGMLPPLNPVTTQKRPVQAVMDSKKTVTIPEGMVWYDTSPPTQGLRFPPGVYTLEAEDADYWYLHSPTPLEFRDFKWGQIVNTHNVSGGIMIGKTWLRMIPAAGYIDGESTNKIMVWKLGNEFLHLEGRYWSKNF